MDVFLSRGNKKRQRAVFYLSTAGGSIIVWRFGGLSQFWVPVCGFIHIYLAVYGYEIIVRLREIRNLARGFRFLHVLVAVIQTVLRGSED